MSSVEEQALADASAGSMVAPQSASIVDGVRASRVVEPLNEAEVTAFLAQASANGTAVITVGGGTHLGLGNPPKAYDVALSTRRMNAIVAYEPADMTVTVQPGVPLRDLRELLAAQGQMLPLDPPGAGGATVGGVLSANVQGPLRHAHGTARDWVIGMRVALATGIAIKSGGRVVKNVTGYDLHKLFIGALGTLGVITEVTLKLAPRPRTTATVAASFDDLGRAAELIAAAARAGLPITACELVSPTTARALGVGDRWCALVYVAAGARAVERSVDDLATQTRAAGGQLTSGSGDAWDRWHAAFAPAGIAMRTSVLPTAVADALVALHDAAGASAHISATAAVGLVRVVMPEVAGAEAAQRMRDVAAQHGGTLVVEAAPPAVKQAIGDVFGSPRADIEMMRRLKQEYDPARIMAPGRFLGRL